MASSSKRSWSLSSLPPEITQEIFYKTPTDALVRSKPTCKKCEYYGIGYSNSKKKARDDGYKIVRFTCGLEGNYEINVVPQVEIYEFKTNSWRTIGVKVDADVKITRKCVAVMGNMYWIAYRDHEEEDEEEEEEDEEEEEEEYEFIRCFDFSDETFKDLGDGDVSFSKYFSLSGPGLRALRVHADAARPVYCFVKPKSVIVWFVGVEGKGDKVQKWVKMMIRVDQVFSLPYW
ncbi:unnamed protein product [Brassica rapa subsp. trilocularis]